ncbi:MAG: putative sulfate exporter family transporter [Alphaproteobacteria bacterium]|nr:putative sulfate exporter family transporter [Alphaproteobacteria bacterium]
MFAVIEERLSNKIPGITISITVAFAASFLSEHYGAPAMLFALLLGMALSFLYEDGKCHFGIDFTAMKVLRVGVALLGFRIVLSDVLELGWQTLSLVFAGVVSTILVGVLAAKVLGLPRRFGGLTGGAVAICGASAALAISAALPDAKHKERDTIFTVIGVTALSTMAMIVYPLIAAFFHLNDTEAGIFIGGTIHDVAQVVGAGYSISEEAGNHATLTKLMRVAMLLPVVLMFVLTFRKDANTLSKKPPVLPGFLVAFVVFVLINSFASLPALATESLTSISRFCLITAIAAIGLKSNLKKVAEVGFRPVVLMVLETVWLAALILVCLPLIG